jgi:hypothetical protein
MKRKVKRFNGKSGSVVNDEPLSAEDKELLNITLEQMRRDVGKSSQDEDDSDISSSYMPRSTFKQEAIGDATNDNIKVKDRKKPVAPAPKKAETPAPKTSAGSGLAGSDTRRTTGEGMAGSDTKPKPKTSKSTRTTADIRSGRPAAEEKPIKVPKLSFLTPERLESSRKSYYSGFESKPVRSTADIRAGRGMKSGGKVSSASSRADGIAQRGKTRGKLR